MEGKTDERQGKIQRSELVLVGFLFLFGIGSIVFGIARLKNTIVSPFRISETPQNQGSLLDGVDRGGIDIEGLKSLDTDIDGLNDYQEIYILHTSQYLSDSDGDGISDKEEVARGNNPNCPEGKTCYNNEAVTRTPINAAVPSSHEDALDPSKAASTANPTEAINQVLSQFQNKTPQQIRELMKEQGIPEEQLKQVPDALLQAMYSQGIDQAIKQVKERGIPESTDTSSSVLPPKKQADPSTLPPQEIRALLERSGKVPLDILQKVPDSALKDIFLKAIQSTKPQTSQPTLAP